MHSIEELVLAFGGLPIAAENRWTLHPIKERRLYLSRDHSGRYSLFLLGDRASFGALPNVSGVEYSDSIESVPDGSRVAAVRLTSSSAMYGNRVIAHVAYELNQRLIREPEVTNQVLLADVRWILELLGEREGILSDDQQKGLVGELVFLRRLLREATDSNFPPVVALSCWHGYDRSKRDFSGPGIAVEVKTTSSETRVHYVGSLAQLEPIGDEKVYVYSVGVRLDASAPRKLPDFVQDIVQYLVCGDGSPDLDLIAEFYRDLREYGYEPAREGLYRSMPGFLNFHLLPRLYREAELDRVRLTSFKGDELPRMVREVSYRIELLAPELNSVEEKVVVRSLLQPRDGSR